MSVWREEPVEAGSEANGWKPSKETKWVESHKGHVLADLGVSPRWLMSDYGWYREALVWDAEKGYPARVTYMTGDAEVWGNGRVEVDATPEVVAANEAYEALRLAGSTVDRILKGASELVKNRPVKIVRGRKLAKGLEGTLIWVGETRYGRRVGVKLASGEVVWTNASNVEIEPKTWAAEVRKRAAEYIEHSDSAYTKVLAGLVEKALSGKAAPVAA